MLRLKNLKELTQYQKNIERGEKQSINQTDRLEKRIDKLEAWILQLEGELHGTIAKLMKDKILVYKFKEKK